MDERLEATREDLGDQPSGGARRDRTDDLMLAKHALSQLSYGPIDGNRRDSAARAQIQPDLAAAHFCALAKSADADAGD